MALARALHMRSVVALLAAAMLAGCASHSQERTDPASDPSRGGILYFTDVVGTHLAFAALGPNPDGTGRTRLLLTTDFGATFKSIGPRTAADELPDSVFFLDRETGWFATKSSGGGNETLYRTTDGGRSWQSSAVPTHTLNAGAVDQLDFISPTVGWLADIQPTGNAEVIYRTDDGGRSWHAIADLRTGDPAVLGQVHFTADGSVGWLAGGYELVSGALERSSDQGRTWKRVTVPADAPAQFGPPAVFGRTVIEPIVSCAGRAEMVRTDVSGDAGSHWIARGSLDVAGRCETPSKLSTAFSSPTDGWLATVAGKQIVVYRSTDQERTWSKVALPTLPVQASHYPPVLQASGGQRAWLIVVGPSVNGQSIYATRDGGVTWRRLGLG